MSDARYTKLSDAERDALPSREREAYDRQRAAFDREVEHKAHLKLHGWLDVGTKGRVVRFNVPVDLRGRR